MDLLPSKTLTHLRHGVGKGVETVLVELAREGNELVPEALHVFCREVAVGEGEGHRVFAAREGTIHQTLQLATPAPEDGVVMPELGFRPCILPEIRISAAGRGVRSDVRAFPPAPGGTP